VLSSILLKPPLFGLFTYDFIKKPEQKLDVGNKFSFKETKGYKWVQVIFNKYLNYFYKEHHKQEQNFNFLASKISAKYFDKQILKANTPNYYIFPLLSENRDKLYNKLLESNIQAGKHFHKCLVWAKEFGYKNGDCPNTEKISKRIITFPIHSIILEKHTFSMIKSLNCI